MSFTPPFENNTTDFSILEIISITLSNTLIGDLPSNNNITCKFTYLKNLENQIIDVHLISVNNSRVNISLNQIEMKGGYGFMSSISPTLIKIDKQKVFIHLIILCIPLFKGKPSAAILFYKDGTYILTSKNWKKKFSISLSS